MSYEKLSEVDDGPSSGGANSQSEDITLSSPNMMLWDPRDNITLLLIPDDPGFKGPCRIDHQILMQVRDSSTAEMILKSPQAHNSCGQAVSQNKNGVSYVLGSNPLGTSTVSSGDDMSAAGDGDRIVLVLDLMAKVIRIHLEGDDDKDDKKSTMQPAVVSYLYSRLDVRLRFDIVSLCDRKTTDDDSRALDFIFRQYTLYSISRHHSIFDDLHMRNRAIAGLSAQDLREIDEKERPNAIARSFETSGLVLREALKAGGTHTGTAIRFLGLQYTNTALYFNARRSSGSVDNNNNGGDKMCTHEVSTPGSIGSGGSAVVSATDSAVEEAAACISREAKLQKAVEKSLRRKAQGESVHAASRTLTSAVLYPVRKIGSAASSLASTKDTEKTAAQRVLLDTMGGLGNGFASICKGMTEGLNEIGEAISAAALDHSRKINGEEYANSVTQNYVDAFGQVGLGIYKVGSVASFGIAGIGIDAMVEGTTYAVSLYEYLVGPVLLQGYMEVVILPFTTPKRLFVVLRPWSIAFYKDAGDFTRKPYKIIANCMLDTIPLVRSREGAAPSGSGDEGAEEGLGYSTAQAPKDRSFYIHRLKGGSQTHIELTTVDCSTYLLYPQETIFHQWLEQLKLACLRVETIQKRQSGAFELAVTRRLRLLPKSNIISISIKSVVLSSIWSTAASKQPRGSSDNALDSEDIDYMPPGDSALHGLGWEDPGIELTTLGAAGHDSDGASSDPATLAALPSSSSIDGSDVVASADDVRVELLEELCGEGASGESRGHDITEPSSSSTTNVARVGRGGGSIQHQGSGFLSGVNKAFKRQFTISNIMEPIKVSVLREAKIELIPVTHSGVKVSDEKCVGRTSLLYGFSLEDYLQHASEGRFARQLPLPPLSEVGQQTLNDSMLLTADWEDCNFEMGNKCSLIGSECECVQMRLIAETALNKKNVELGRVSFKLESMSAAACVYTWVDLFTKKSGKIVGKALVALVQDGN